MDITELRRLKSALDRFAREFDDCIKTVPSRRHLLRYMNGQLGALKRKSIEPIALDESVNPKGKFVIGEKESAEDIPSPWLSGARFRRNLLNRHPPLASEEDSGNGGRNGRRP